MPFIGKDLVGKVVDKVSLVGMLFVQHKLLFIYPEKIEFESSFMGTTGTVDM